MWELLTCAMWETTLDDPTVPSFTQQFHKASFTQQPTLIPDKDNQQIRTSSYIQGPMAKTVSGSVQY